MEKRIELITKAQEGDAVAYEQLLNEDLKLILSVADVYKKYAPLTKIMAAALEGWNKALASYHKPEIRYVTYTMWWMKEWIHRALKVETRNLDGHGTDEEAAEILNKVYGKNRVNL